MACLQTLNGIVRDCLSNVGGVRKVYIANKDDVASITITDDAVSAITMEGGAKFKEYYQKPGRASVTSTPQFNDANEYAGESVVLSLSFPRQDATKRLEVAALSVAELVVVYQDANGNCWLLGYDNPVQRSGGDATSGQAVGDTNAYALELTATENQLPYSVPVAVIEALVG